MLWWTLQQLKSSNPDARMRAVQVLGSAKSRKAVPALIKLLLDANPQVRLATMEALGAIAHPAAVNPLVSALNHFPGNDKSNLAAEGEAIAKALGRIGAPAIHPLIRTLESEDREARRWSAHALGIIKDPQAVDPLISKLEDTRSEVRKTAALALGEIGDVRAVKSLTKAAASRDLESRRAAVEALGQLKSAEGVEAVIRAAEDSSESVQLAAINALASIGGLLAAASLRSAMSGPRKAVRDAAESALRSMHFELSNAEERAEFALIRGDHDAAFREGQAAVPALMKALGFKDPGMRVQAAEMLASLQSPESVPPLLVALKDHHAQVQVSAARALTSIGTGARAGLEEALSYYDASVVRLAAEALGEIGAPDSVPALAGLLNANGSISGEYPDLFDAVGLAAEALGKILRKSGAEISRDSLDLIAALPEAVHLQGSSPRVLDCSALRADAARLSQTLMDRATSAPPRHETW